jgi:hypothetical protein
VVSRPLFLLMLRAMRVGAGGWSGMRKLLGAGESPRSKRCAPRNCWP